VSNSSRDKGACSTSRSRGCFLQRIESSVHSLFKELGVPGTWALDLGQAAMDALELEIGAHTNSLEQAWINLFKELEKKSIPSKFWVNPGIQEPSAR